MLKKLLHNFKHIWSNWSVDEDDTHAERVCEVCDRTEIQVRCEVNLHKWGKWVDGSIKIYSAWGTYVGEKREHQARKCKICNLEQWSKVI